MNILILEDELSLADSMADFLEELGYKIDIFSNSNDAKDAIYSKDYSLLLLDVKVYGDSGFEMLKELREFGVKVPAIFVTSLTSIDDLTIGYESGCCDYIRKPFELEELQLRVENVLKNQFDSSSDFIVKLSKGYSYDLKKFKLFNEQGDISLTKTEIKIIELLLKNRGDVVSIEKFSDLVWNHSVLEANVRVQINQLRKKTDKELIKNIRGLGYMIDS